MYRVAVKIDRQISKGLTLMYVSIGSTALVPKIAGSNQAEAVGFFGRNNPQHAFPQRGSKAVCPMSQICGMLRNPAVYRGSWNLQTKFLGHFSPAFVLH
jgi:hypothetical protein